jgi:hypothetical protein
MLDDVTRHDRVEMFLARRRVLDAPDVYVAAHDVSWYRGGNRIGFDAANPPTEQLHDAQKAAAASDFEEPATRLEAWYEVLLAVAGSRPDRRNARQDRTCHR